MTGWLQVLRNISPRALRVWQRDADAFRSTMLVNFIPPMLEPVLYVVAFGFGLGSLVKTVSYQGREIGYLEFMVPGIVCVAVMFWSFFENTYYSFARMYFQRTFDAMLATPLLVEDVIVGEWLWGATKSLLAGSIMLVMISLFGLVRWPEGLLVLPLAMLGGFLFAGLGLVATALAPQIDSFNLPMFTLIYPMFLFSGTFFPIDILPGWARTLAMVLPLTHLSFLVRGACLGHTPRHALASLAYLLFLTVVAACLAVILMRRRLVK